MTARAGGDPFGAAQVRRRVLDAWASMPARFREDANAEQDFALGGYRDRLVVELAQNALDAARRAGVPGELALSFDGQVLRAANVGAPLDRAGAHSLASLRASAKRDGASVGRFGVGFAAVLAVTDAPQVRSRNGGVRFSADDTRAAVAAVDALAPELARRGGAVPVLRLPWPVADPPADGFDTEVVLPVPADRAGFARELLDRVDASLLLALPLDRLRVDERRLSRQQSGDRVVIADGDDRREWVVRAAGGDVPAALLADRPVEEPDRWSITWALPVDPAGPAAFAPVLHAPTPSDEPVSLPAMLIASFPLDPDRRHVAPGPLTDFLVERAAELYPELVSAAADPLALVPRPTLASGPLDAALARACLDALAQTPFLTAVDGSAVAPRAATRVEGFQPDALVDVVGGLLPARYSAPAARRALDALGARRLSTADVVEQLAGIDRPPAWWRELYAAVTPDAETDALGGLPVPLADGRTVTGARGALLPDVDLPAAVAEPLGLRVVDPAAAHPLLERLGAARATARSVLADPRVAAMAADPADPAPVAAAVLALLESSDASRDEFSWLSQLLLPSADGAWQPAGEMAMPGSPLARAIRPDSPFGQPAPELVERWGREVLGRAGVLSAFLIEHYADFDPEDADFDGADDWLREIQRRSRSDAPVELSGVAAVLDVEYVGNWPAALAILADEPYRSAIATPVRGPGFTAPSYTRWWLSTHPVLGGRRPKELRAAGAVDLAGLYDVADAPADVAELVGVHASLDAVLGDPADAADLLWRLADPERTAAPLVLRDIYLRLAHALADAEVELPRGVRTVSGRVAEFDAAVVLDQPFLFPLVDAEIVPGGGDAALVADFLDLDLASERVGPTRITSTPTSTGEWADVGGAALAAARCGGATPSARVVWHDGLAVNGIPASWWPDDDVDHVDLGAAADGLGRALAWRLGRWDARLAAVEALRCPDDIARLSAEDAAGRQTLTG